MTLAGSVTVAGDGTATGDGIALALYTLLLAQASFAVIPPGAAGVQAKTQLAETANVFATIADGRRFRATPVKLASYNAQPYDLVLCDPSAGTMGVTLPTPSAANDGTLIAVKNVTTSTNLIVCAPLIDVSVLNMNAARAGMIFICDFATGWYPLGNAVSV